MADENTATETEQPNTEAFEVEGGDATKTEATDTNSQDNSETATDEPQAFAAEDTEDANEDGDTGDDAGSEQEGDDQEGAPEDYGDFELPENAQIDEGRMDTFVEECKERNLTKEQAQERLDDLLSWKAREEQTVKDYWKEQAKTFTAMSKEKGLMEPQVLAMAQTGLKNAGDDGTLSRIFVSLGVDRHPALIEAFSNYGKKTSNDREVPSPNMQGKDEQPLQERFQNSFKAK